MTAKTLGCHQVTCTLVMECLKRLNTLGLTNRVCVFWVLGHIAIERDGIADKLERIEYQLLSSAQRTSEA